MNKLWILVWGLALLPLFYNEKTVECSQQIPVSPVDDVEYDYYTVYDLLETALNNSSFNRYKLQKTFSSNGLTLCVPVTYQLYCATENECSSSINGTSSVSMSFLWTLFNTGDFAGKFLLFFTKNHLRSPFLGLPNHLCSFSKEEEIILYLQIGKFPCLSVNASDEVILLVSKVLKSITGQLMDYTPGLTGEPAGGHGLIWTEDRKKKFDKRTEQSDYYIPISAITLAFFVAVSGSGKALEFVRKNVNEKKSPNFFSFWSFQIVAAIVNVINVVYIFKVAPTAGQTHIVNVLAPLLALVYCAVFSVVTFCKPACCTCTCSGYENLDTASGSTSTNRYGVEVRDAAVQCGDSVGAADEEVQDAAVQSDGSENKDGNGADGDDLVGIQVPCTSWSCCDKEDCSSSLLYYRRFVFFLAIYNTFIFFLFIAYTSPWVVLGFYLYPIKVLVRISFLLTIGLCLMLNIAVILYFGELCTSYMSCCQSKQPCTQENCCSWDMPKRIVQLFTALFALAALVFVGIILYHIVFVFEFNFDSTLEDLLTIVPTVAVTVSAYVFHGKVTLGGELKSVISIGRNKDSANIQSSLPDTATTHYGAVSTSM